MSVVEQIVGQTPLVKLEYFSEKWGASIYAKYEAVNPGSSIKDRPARTMIEQAEARGVIAPGKTTLIEPTSGNTGIALAMLGATKGYDVVLVMPESMSKERRALLRAYGARLELTPAAEGMAGALRRADELAAQMDNAWIVGQFTNPDNPLAHERGTGPEIEAALGHAPDVLVAGVGTGGTVSGTAHYFEKSGAQVAVWAVEPAESPLISQHLAQQELTPASHGIQGIGANFIPANLDAQALTGAVSVPTAEAIELAREIAQKEGFLVGISSGANLAAVRRLLLEHPEYQGSCITTFLVDTGERYISTPLFEGIA